MFLKKKLLLNLKTDVKVMKKAIVILCALLCVTTAVAIVPSTIVEDIVLNPTNPAPLDTITFSISLVGDVHFNGSLIVQECDFNTGIYYTVQNISLPGNSLEHSINVTLMHADATYISYWVSIKNESDNGTWIDYDTKKLNLTINNNVGGDVGNGILPLIILVIVVVCFVIGYFGFKRLMKKWEK
jgi:hypothetical protein